MDLQTQKLNAIEFLIGIDNEEAFGKIEATILQTIYDERQLNPPFTEQQLIDRAKKANADFTAGRVLSQEQLEVESLKW